MLLLAQLVEPPLQQGPIRLPDRNIQEERPAEDKGEPTLTLPDSSQPAPAAPAAAPPANPPDTGQPLAPTPELQGQTPYSPVQLTELLRPCRGIADPDERLKACAAAITGQLVNDGYINTRVYVLSSAGTGLLEVVEGRIVELRVDGPDARLNQKVVRLLRPLRGQVLQVPRLEADLRLLGQPADIASVRGNLSRLGSDPSQAILSVKITPADQPWQGNLAVRNDGNNGPVKGGLWEPL